MLPNPISYSEIVGYAQMEGLDVREAVQMVQALDGVWLSANAEAQRKQAERKQQKGEGKPDE